MIEDVIRERNATWPELIPIPWFSVGKPRVLERKELKIARPGRLALTRLLGKSVRSTNVAARDEIRGRHA